MGIFFHLICPGTVTLNTTDLTALTVHNNWHNFALIEPVNSLTLIH